MITKMPYFELRKSDFHQTASRRSPDSGLSADTFKRSGTNIIGFYNFLNNGPYMVRSEVFTNPNLKLKGPYMVRSEVVSNPR